jgi:hypothetical protein
MSRRICSSRLRNLRPGYAAALMVAGTVLVPAASHARDIVPSIRPIVALKEPAARLDSFILLLDTAGAADTAGRDAFKHHFFEQKTADAGIAPPPPGAGAAAPVSVSPAAPAPAIDEPPTDSSSDSSGNASSAKSDPNFDRWQKDANDRLKEEDAVKESTPHPLAAANPGKSVVVCEAGCRTSKDEIVYIAAVVQADVPDKKFEPNAANPDEGSVPCIAGCYDRDEPQLPASRPHAEIARPVQTSTRVAAADRTGKFVHDVTAAIAPEKTAPEKTLPETLPRKGGPHAAGKTHRIQTAHNGAIIEGRRLSRAANLLRNVHIKTTAAYRKKPVGSWQARLTHSDAQSLRRQSLLGSTRRTLRPHAWQAYVHVGSR